MSDYVEAQVQLHGRHVGVLRYRMGGSSFDYQDDLTAPGHRTLGQIFEDEPRKRLSVRTGLPPWFANLLPEGELRKQIMREMGGYVHDFTLLLRLGASLPGAVTVRGENEPIGDPLENDDSDIASPDHPIRHSLAGVQLKFSVRGSHLTFPASGEGAWWIAKLPDRSLKDLSLNEYLTMRWLQNSGMNVPRVQLVPAYSVHGLTEGLVDRDELVYLIERFDRRADGSVHVEDFAQVADVAPKFKYSDSGVTYDSMGRGISDLLGIVGFLEYVSRLTAMIIAGNTDAHIKNWALIYLDGQTPSLSPVYDFHSLTLYSRYRFSPLALSLDGETLPGGIRFDNFRRLAEQAGCDPERSVQTVRQTVADMRAAWAGDLKKEADARAPALAQHYLQRLATLPICRD